LNAVKFLLRKYQRMGRWSRVIIGQQVCFGDSLGRQAEPEAPHSRRTKERDNSNNAVLIWFPTFSGM
jgi:hypothetical protein